MSLLNRSADIEFMAEFMASENAGRFNWFERRGFTLQNAGAGVLRCIHIVDAEYAFLCLAMANETIKLAGGVFLMYGSTHRSIVP